MKKTVSYVIVFVMMLSAISFINIALFSAKADTTGVNIYEETNTYNVDTIRENVPSAPEDPIQYTENQYIIKYNMNNKINRAVADYPTVTVFTHGYNSSARDWSNNMETAQKRENFCFAYNKNSIISKIINLYGVDNCRLLCVKMTGYKSFFINDFTTVKDKFVLDAFQSVQLTQNNFGKHLVIMFEAADNTLNSSNNNVYFQFNYMLSSILYDLKQLDPSHRIPKVNLIGHSRGGITNMQYALDHPDIVANLISIGSPYDGSTSSVLMKDNDDYGGDGLNDIINSDKYNNYKDRWNQNHETLYKDINVLAIGAYSTLPFLGAVAHNDKI